MDSLFDVNKKAEDRSDELLEFECEQAMLRKAYAPPEINTEWTKIQQNIHHSEKRRKRRTHYNVSMQLRYFSFGAIAATLTLLVILYVFRPQRQSVSNGPVTVFLAQRGKQAVTITGNGNRVAYPVGSGAKPSLSGAVVNTEKADFTNVESNITEVKTIMTPRGKDYKVILNDGTEVIMNTDSKLIFPVKFTGSKRIVTLEGEAYFKVAKNASKPFIVRSGRLETLAVGTEFNVRAYDKSVPHVTLIEGKVIVNVAGTAKKVYLRPGEDVSLTNDDMNIKNVDSQYYIQWKEGFLYYDDVPLVDVLSDLGRWYNINIEIEKSSLMAYRLHFIVNKSAKIDEVIDNLNDFEYLFVRKIGNKIIISEKN